MKELIYPPEDCTITSSRVFSYSVDLVYQAWTDPVHLINWWGPEGFTNTFNKHDLKPGGRWSFVMHGPKAGHYKNECIFIKIEKNTFLSWYRLSDPVFQVQVRFNSNTPGSTEVVFKMLFEDSNLCRKIASFAVVKNEENFDRLHMELERMRLLRTIKEV